MSHRDARPSIPGAFNAEMAETLENLGATEGLLQLWAGHENRLFERTAEQSFALPIQWRSAAVDLARDLTRHMERPRSCFFGAVQLFDASCSHMVEVGAVPEIHRVLSWVAAAWLLNFKISDEPSMYPLGIDELARIASHHSNIFGGRQIEPEDIQLAEAVLFRQSSCYVWTTTVETWLNAYALRFDLVTGYQMLRPHLGVLEAACARWTSSLTLLISYASTNTPRMAACGIFGLALLALRILPIEALSPAESTQAADWAMQVEQIIAFTEAQMDVEQLDLQSMRMPVQPLDGVIEFATLCKKAEVQDRTAAIVRNLLEAAGVPLPRVAAAAEFRNAVVSL